MTDEQAKQLVIRLNALTTELYGNDQRVSRILLDRGLTQRDISILRHRLPQFIQDAAAAVVDSIYRLYPEDPRADRFVVILRDRYGLNEHRPKTLQSIGEDLSISRERVRQLQEKLVGKLRHPASRTVIEDALLRTARSHIRRAVADYRAGRVTA